MARAGLLEGHCASVHWCYAAAFAVAFPDIAASDDVIARDRRRVTVSGAAAAFDLALLMIEESLGGDVATEVACWFQHPLVRGQGVRQRTPTIRRDSTGDMLDDDDILRLVRNSDSLEAGGKALIDGANEAGGRDNISVILARATGAVLV